MTKGIPKVPKTPKNRRITLELTAEDEELINQALEHLPARLGHLDLESARVGVVRAAMRLGLGVGQPPADAETTKK